jgi:hypothetical protein
MFVFQRSINSDPPTAHSHTCLLKSCPCRLPISPRPHYTQRDLHRPLRRNSPLPTRLTYTTTAVSSGRSRTQLTVRARVRARSGLEDSRRSNPRSLMFGPHGPFSLSVEPKIKFVGFVFSLGSNPRSSVIELTRSVYCNLYFFFPIPQHARGKDAAVPALDLLQLAKARTW